MGRVLGSYYTGLFPGIVMAIVNYHGVGRCNFTMQMYYNKLMLPIGHLVHHANSLTLTVPQILIFNVLTS